MVVRRAADQFVATILTSDEPGIAKCGDESPVCVMEKTEA